MCQSDDCEGWQDARHLRRENEELRQMLSDTALLLRGIKEYKVAYNATGIAVFNEDGSDYRFNGDFGEDHGIPILDDGFLGVLRGAVG